MLPSQDYSNHLYCGKKIQDIWILSKSTFTLRLVSIVLLNLPFRDRFVLPCTPLQLIQREYQGNPLDSGLQILVIQYSSIQVTFSPGGVVSMLTYIQVLIQQGQAQQMFFTKKQVSWRRAFKKGFFIHPFPKTRAKKTHSNSDIMTHIEGNKQETTVLLSALETVSSGSQQTLHFGKPSPAVLLSHQTMQSQRTDLAPPLGQARSKVSHQPCLFIDKLGESAHYQAALLNFILMQEEVNTTQSKIKFRSWKFRSWKFCCHSSYLLNLKKKRTILLLVLVF